MPAAHHSANNKKVNPQSQEDSAPPLTGLGECLSSVTFSPDDLAAQLTIMDQIVFRSIGPEELTSCSWNKKNKLEVAPNIVNLTRRFNHVSFWTVDEVLKGDTPKQRAEIMAHFIRVAKVCTKRTKIFEFRFVTPALIIEYFSINL